MTQNPQLKLKPRPSTFTIGSLLVSIDPAARVMVTPLRDSRVFATMSRGAQANTQASPQH